MASQVGLSVSLPQQWVGSLCTDLGTFISISAIGILTVDENVGTTTKLSVRTLNSGHV